MIITLPIITSFSFSVLTVCNIIHIWLNKDPFWDDILVKTIATLIGVAIIFGVILWPRKRDYVYTLYIREVTKNDKLHFVILKCLKQYQLPYGAYIYGTYLKQHFLKQVEFSTREDAIAAMEKEADSQQLNQFFFLYLHLEHRQHLYLPLIENRLLRKKCKIHNKWKEFYVTHDEFYH